MSWNYSGDPSTSDKDAVRFLAGDTDDCDQLVQDEEILWELTQESNIYLAAADIAEVISTQFARLADTKIGPVSESLSQKAEAYQKRADKLKDRAKGTGRPIDAEIFVGGISISGKRELRDNTDAVQPSFKFEMDDHPAGPDERAHDPGHKFHHH